MSLLIYGLDMPKNCADCPILQTGSLEHYCPLAKESMWSIDTESGRHNNCPLSEIPTPHGSLIDRDDLLAYFDRKAKGKTAEEALKLLYTALKAYPAVIGKEMN